MVFLWQVDGTSIGQFFIPNRNTHRSNPVIHADCAYLAEFCKGPGEINPNLPSVYGSAPVFIFCGAVSVRFDSPIINLI